jgi:hypothetical protein
MKKRKLLQKAVSGSKNLRSNDLTALVESSGIPELINLQESDGMAKPYQVRQFLKLVERYNLELEDEK